jgi:hypothetical protein
MSDKDILIRRRGSAGKNIIAATIVVLEGTQRTPPHTYKTSKGEYCATDRWFDMCALVYDSSITDNEIVDHVTVGTPGGRYKPMLALQGRDYSVYYPNSTEADYKAIMTSGSSGRWLHRWSQKSNYVRF